MAISAAARADRKTAKPADEIVRLPVAKPEEHDSKNEFVKSGVGSDGVKKLVSENTRSLEKLAGTFENFAGTLAAGKGDAKVLKKIVPVRDGQGFVTAYELEWE